MIYRRFSVFLRYTPECLALEIAKEETDTPRRANEYALPHAEDAGARNRLLDFAVWTLHWKLAETTATFRLREQPQPTSSGRPEQDRRRWKGIARQHTSIVTA
jgi:hypothetical protein